MSGAAALGLVLAATALAMPSAEKDPSQLILARTDFPAGATYTWGQMPANYIQALAGAGIKGKAAFFHVMIGNGAKAQTVDGYLTTTGSASQAKKLYKLTKADLPTSRSTTVRLPSYGDEQVALLTTKTVSKIELLVRKNRTVWQVETARGVPAATLIAEIKKHASRQKARVGPG